jgi:cortexillin 1/2
MAEDLNAKDQAWQSVQKKAFTHWVNTVVEKRAIKIETLETSMADGVTVIHFIELLTDKKLKKKWANAPKQRIQYIENTHLGLEHLLENGVQKKYLTISAEDFVDKNLKLILGFLWMLFRKFRIAKSIGVDEDSTTEGLLLWVKQMTDGYKGVQIRDFKSSFSDGNAFLALVHAYDKKAFDYNHQLEEHSTQENVEYAFNSAEKSLGIPQLLDPAELQNGSIDERSVVLYVSLFFHAFVSAQEKNKIEGEKRAMTEKVVDLETLLQQTQEENETLNKRLGDKDADIRGLKSSLEEKEKSIEKLQHEKEEAEQEVSEMRNRFKKLKEELDARAALEKSSLDVLRKNLVEHLNDMNQWKDFLEQDREYESERVQQRSEKEIADRSFEDQLEYLSDALGSENRKLEVLLRQREIEEKAAAAKKPALPETAELKRVDEGEKKKKPKKKKAADE